MASSNVLQVGVPFAAPVPRGNDVGYARIRHPEAGYAGELVIDLTAGVVYCIESMRSVLAHPAVASDPLLVARENGWEVDEHVVGRTLGAVVATQQSRALPPIQTTLFLDTSPRSAPYR